MNSVLSLGAVTLLGLAGCTRAESQTGLTLEAKLSGGFGQLSNVVELDSGRVAFTDTRDKLFLSAAFGTGELDTLGKRVEAVAADSAPGEYKFPGWVAQLAGDTLALVDFSVLRTTLWTEGGKPLRVLPIAPVGGTAPVLVYDTVGHGYKIDYQSLLAPGPGQAKRPDSVPVLRIALRGGKVDTVARLAAPEFGEATFGEQKQPAATVFAPNDFFGVLPNGTAWVARGRDNRVDWRAPDGKWTPGKSRKYTGLPVTQADKDRVLAQVREQGKQYGMPQELAIQYPFAQAKPPFDFALGRPSGEVWLQRPRVQEGAALVYDVYNRQGAWQREVAFPAGASLAGFGESGAIYASLRNEDGTRTVGRYRLR
ncbi:MAG: hypothetical protein H0T50_00655 [Gemmatimonadales bacterium]|nr:hypothetical protein [Gemmatimonadales bacterium]